MENVEVWFWVWVVAAALLFVAEIFTAGFFMLPFGIGATVAAILAYLAIPVAWQWGGFIAVSTIAFILFRRLAERLTKEPPMRMGADRLIGKVGIVIEEVQPDTPVGQVRIEREEWRADTRGQQVIPVGARVVVEGIEGTHLMVREESGIL